MPGKFLQPCAKCGVASKTRMCEKCAGAAKQFDKITHLHSAERLSAAKRGYDRRWTRSSKRFIAEKKYCANTKKHGALRVLAQETDHIIPHRGDMNLFWDRNNWQALCKACHSEKTATEDGGFGNLTKKRPEVVEIESDAENKFF